MIRQASPRSKPLLTPTLSFGRRGRAERGWGGRVPAHPSPASDKQRDRPEVCPWLPGLWWCILPPGGPPFPTLLPSQPVRVERTTFAWSV